VASRDDRRRKKKGRKIALGLVAVVLGTWSSVGTALVVAVSTEPPGLDPTTNAAAVIKLLLHHNVYECLVQFDAQANLHGQLATSWSVSEDSLEYTLTVREGVQFHDGTPCDAEAVRRSFGRTLDPQTGHPNRSLYSAVQDVVADGSSVRFTLKYPYAPFLALLALGDSVVVPAGRCSPQLGVRSAPSSTPRSARSSASWMASQVGLFPDRAP